LGTVKVLIPAYKPGNLDAKVYPHWKDAEVFTEIELRNNEIYSVKPHILSSDTLIINLVKKEKINYVITQSLSIRALELLNRFNVIVLTGKIKTVRDAIEKFKKKDLYIVSLSKTKLD